MYFVNIHIIQIDAYYVAGHSFKNYTYLGLGFGDHYYQDFLPMQ